MKFPHPYNAKVVFDGGNMDCGNGLLFLIRKNIDPLNPGELLEILSTESSVEEDLPAWCRLTKNELISIKKDGNQCSFLVSKGPFTTSELDLLPQDITTKTLSPKTELPKISNPDAYCSREIENYSVMGPGELAQTYLDG